MTIERQIEKQIGRIVFLQDVYERALRAGAEGPYGVDGAAEELHKARQDLAKLESRASEDQSSK